MQFASLLAFSREIAGVVAATAPAVAAVHAGRHSSSAIHWRDGLFAAASETIEREEDITLILPSGRSAPAEFVGRDPTTGIALLRPGREMSEADLIALADRAMYQVKHGAKGGVALLED